MQKLFPDHKPKAKGEELDYEIRRSHGPPNVVKAPT